MTPFFTKLIGIIQHWWKRYWVKGLVAFGLILVGIDRCFPPGTDVRYSTVVTAADGSVLHAFLNRQDKWRLYTSLSEITPGLRKAIVFKEDRYFYYHPGFNPVSMLRAMGRNLLTGRRTSGASTITMQVVRLLKPRSRTYGSKLIELFRAMQLEWHYSKDEILQLYLNLIPYGSNIEGIKSAALLYFGKPPALLSLAELTTLAIIPNQPSSLRLGQNNAFVMQARNRWLEQFRAANLFTESAIDDARREPLTARRREAPQLAPHLARRLRRENPATPIVQSTLQPAVQDAAEQLVHNYLNRVRAVGIQNAAVLVVNNQTGAVEAYVGSADFQNTLDGGQVDGVRAVRSPGSALKPLLYGLAFDAGLITPKTKLIDVPTNFSGYEPENYDRRFNGPVTAEFALANSLNIPAVALLKDISTPSFIDALKKSGFSTIQKQSKDLGLSMILGGCGVTLEEMTRLYVALANEGRTKPLTYQTTGTSPASTPAKGVELLSPEAAFLITNTLAQITRPDLPNNFDNSYHLPRIAWKTGTSYGRRDAWSIGYNRHYTIGVWVGNFSGMGVPELSGANTATPLLFQLFNALDYNSARGWFRVPGGKSSRLTMRQICPESGDLPNEFCGNRTTDYAIEGVSRSQRCQHRTVVFTDPAGTVSYCAHCSPSAGAVARTYPNLVPELLAYYKAQQIPYEAIPPHNPACERVFAAVTTVKPALTITSPNNGSEYFVSTRQPAQMQLSCLATNDVQTVFWYLNDKFYRRSRPGDAVFFAPVPGRLKISCADDKGRHQDIRILVRPE